MIQFLKEEVHFLMMMNLKYIRVFLARAIQKIRNVEVGNLILKSLNMIKRIEYLSIKILG